jgi:hypothetical protein
MCGRVTNRVGRFAGVERAEEERMMLIFVSGSTQETGALVAYKPDSGLSATRSKSNGLRWRISRGAFAR